MVARISVGKNLYDALARSQNKVDEGGAEVLSAHLLCYPEDGRSRPNKSMRRFLEQVPNRHCTEKPVIHISLNPYPNDVLTDGQLAGTGREYIQRLGYGNQPHLVSKYEDIGRHRIYIVSLRVDSEGRKTSDKFGYRRSKKIAGLLEQKYGLHPAESRRKGEEWQLELVDIAKGDIKRQVACTLRPLLKLYNLRTVGELRALPPLYNIGAEEVKEEIGGCTYHGILYTALDGSSEAVATPIKSFRLGRMADTQQLDRRIRESAAKTKPAPYHGRFRLLVTEALRRSAGEWDSRSRLAKEQTDLVLRRNGTGRTYDVTFIDHCSRTVLDGSRLGKEFSANTLDRCSQKQSQDLLPPLLPSVPSVVVPGSGKEVLRGLLSGIRLELNYVPRHPRLLEPDKKKRRRCYGCQD